MVSESIAAAAPGQLTIIDFIMSSSMWKNMVQFEADPELELNCTNGSKQSIKNWLRINK